MENDLLLYTIEEVATILKVTKRTVYNYINSGALIAAKIGKHWRIKALDLKSFIDDSIIVI